MDREGDMQGGLSWGHSSCQEREGGQESSRRSLVRVLPSRLRPEPSRSPVPGVQQGCDVGGRPPKARMRSPIPEACIPDLTLLSHSLASVGLLFPSLSFHSDIAIPGLRQEPSAFKGLRNVSRILSAGF